MRKLLLSSIVFYQKYLSHKGLGCRFQPTCSRYAYQAIEKYGILHGVWLGVLRIIRCHPWHPGGFDPLP